MNENRNKRREWVKTVAIIFLTIMLILTFFSNTIMNYSLPEVAAQYVQSGTITAKIRGNGVIESGDPYNVKIKGVRKVESIEVRQGDKVEKGQVLCFLSEEDSTELENAKEALKLAEDEFDLALLNATISNSNVSGTGSEGLSDNDKAKILLLKKEIEKLDEEAEKLNKNVKDLTDKSETLTSQISLTNTNTVDITVEKKAVSDAKDAMDEADLTLKGMKNDLQTLVAKIELQGSVSDGNSTSLDELTAAKSKLELEIIDAEDVYNDAVLAYEKAGKQLEKKEATNTKDAAVAKLEKELATVGVNLQTAQNAYDSKAEEVTGKKEELQEILDNFRTDIELGSIYDKIENAEAEVKRLEALVGANEVVAPLAGTIMGINVKSGLETPEDGIVFTMQPEGEGYTLSFSVTSDQAKRLAVGDVAEPVNAWRYDDLQIVLANIKPDPAEPANKKLLIFNVSGESVIPNQSLNVSVGERSAQYDLLVPNSAIREDNKGKFILIVESKSSPIGTRYTASRVDVEVLASDDTQSAISGALYGWEFVITTSTKPIEEGQQVRLPE